MSNAFAPRDYQRDIIRHILNVPRCAVWAGMGLGKTVSVLSVLDMLELAEPGPALVLAPMRVATTTWPDEAEKWEHLKNIRVVAVTGTATERLKKLAAPANVYTINYDNLPWLVEHFKNDWPFKKIIADESTKLKSFRLGQGGSRAAALGKIAHTRVERFIELTGTPSPNGLQDLWGQIWFLDRGERLGRSYSAFISRWFSSVQIGVSPFARKITPLPHAQREITELLKDLCLSIDAKDFFNLADPIVTDLRITMPKRARRVYREMEKEMLTRLDSGAEVEAFNVAAKTVKCLQLANGALYEDEDCRTYIVTHDEKINALKDIVEEAAGMPVLVAYHFKSDVTRLLKAFPEGRALDSNPETIRAWNQGKIPVLFAHPASAGQGLNLQDGGNILVFFAHWWDLEHYQQILERIGPARQAQSGHNRPVFVHHIIAADTVDDLVMKRRQSKKEIQEILLAATKRKAE